MTAMWSPSVKQIADTQVEAFRHAVNKKHNLTLADYNELHRWSVEHSEAFWLAVWEFTDIKASHRGSRVLENADAMPGAKWFPEARLNYAENCLRRNDKTPAIIATDESGELRELTHAQLRAQVAAVANALRAEGVAAGDRVAGLLPNIPEAVVAMLATASIGAVWSSCSPDFGVNGVLDRFGQIEPKVLFCTDGYRYNGRNHDSTALIDELAPQLNGLQRIIMVEFINEGKPGSNTEAMTTTFQGLLESNATDDLPFEQLAFDHPLFIMFSSGTTGKPKCIVHGAGGTLLQHKKEHQLHVDVSADERLFFFTTCGWMMWNWLVTGLASEATLLLYDGSPFYPDGNTLFNFADQTGMHYLGTSAKFIDACNKASIDPINTHKLQKLKAVLSTGSPLVPESFDYVYKHIASDISLASMSGGTDIISCFILGNPALPVHRGELQSLGLGLDVQVFNDLGEPLPAGEKGELVCCKPFPCMPTGFYKDEDGSRYHAAYFDKFTGVWCHGDYIATTEHSGVVIYGRSDAVLNPGGVRIGTAEIYRQVESIDTVVESLVIGQQWQGDVRVVLFVRLRENLQLDDALIALIKSTIRENATPRHVPAVIVQVADIPRTRSGKIVELAVRKIVHGETIDNIEALANPEALALYENIEQLQ
jgi:acetoacetyl-CoA synthetase